MDALPAWGDIKLPPPVAEAVASLGWNTPSAVQQATIPLLLRGKDVAVQSATGSGKTGAFGVPLVSRVVSQRLTGTQRGGPAALVLSPSVELAEQTSAVLAKIAQFVKPRVHIENVCTRAGDAPPLTGAGEDFIVSTPAALAKALRGGTALPSALQVQMVVIDEADLLVSMASLAVIQRLLPPTAQTTLVSATLTDSVASIQRTMLRRPVTVKVEDEDAPANEATPVADAEDVQPLVETRTRSTGKLHHRYLVATDEAHHHTLLYSLFRLQLLEGKTLIFVEDEEDTYRLQHFLEQMSIAAVVYDASLPLNVRFDTLKRFQKNSQGVLICTDTTLENAERAHEGAATAAGAGLQRGVDFRNVRNVVMFDGVRPGAATFANYVHRAGRTARAGESGCAITIMSVRQSRAVSHDLRAFLKSRGEDLRAFKALDRGSAAKMQYRVDSALTNVTRAAARKLRVATVASELAKSSFLSSRLNQGDTAAIKKLVGKVEGKVKADKTLAAVPAYMKVGADTVANYRKRVRAQHHNNREVVFSRVARAKRSDPLQQVVAKVRRDEQRVRVAKSEKGARNAGKKR